MNLFSEYEKQFKVVRERNFPNIPFYLNNSLAEIFSLYDGPNYEFILLAVIILEISYDS